MDIRGKTVTKTKVVRMSAGKNRALKFDFDKPMLTQVNLKVPKDAEVELHGNKTTIKGTSRRFTTTDLAEGQSWKDYEVIVSVQRNGKRLTKQKTITVAAGGTYDLNFDFAQDRVAAK